jgi:lactoylglutathione lyase
MVLISPIMWRRLPVASKTFSRYLSIKARPFRILGVQQIAIGSLHRSGFSIWYDILGLKPESSHHLPKENVDEDIISLGPKPYAVEIDLMTPIDPEKSPKVHVPPLNHIGLWVDDLPSAVYWMTEQGVRFTPGGIRVGAAGHKVAFIHPKGNDDHPVSGNGVLIELVQAPDDIQEAFSTK